MDITNTTATRLARILRTARNGKGMTQEHLAAAAEVSVPTVKRAETTGAVSTESLRALCAVLGLDVEDTLARAARSGGESGKRLFIREASDTRFMPWIGCVLTTMALYSMWILIASYSIEKPLDIWDTILLVSFLAATSLPSSLILWLLGPAQRRWVFGIGSFLAAGAACTANMLPSLAPSPGSIGQIALGFLVVLGLVSAAELVIHTTMAQLSFAGRMCNILDALADIVRGRVGDDALKEAERLLAEAQDLADACHRANDVRPLECLLEDLHRGISGRRGLEDYIALARTTCFCDRLDERLKREAAAVMTELEQRVRLPLLPGT